MNSTLPALDKPVARTKEIDSVCVFCGSGPGGNPEYVEQASRGGSVGVMGAVARGVIDNGGNVKGIVPEPLFRHGSKQIASETIVVADMHTRKKTMGDLSDAFVVLPGGFGTAEEMLEMITWSQLNIHSKPILLLNTNGFYDLFVKWIEHAVQEKFIHSNNARIFVLCNTIEELLDALKKYEAPTGRYGLDWIKSSDGVSGRDVT
ncbi:hypothetical protein BDB00DRAFT_758214 [Zychaea mexicana]|uniref:uncharacterized protein n=1 Tax=Zychaea mexicana TaxID=64656 RepID=UPI0022FE47D7|nr:uncharacterized protein BDB00DRAFT_758214 [Zychaea mexicana]KAI9496454.1 hypothetical protein BDB00DRAFT_758214 [Zychaea mexicana]